MNIYFYLNHIIHILRKKK
jgi:hypothetical protein